MEQLDQQGRKQGEFKVRLPDGRIQVTSYQAVSVDLYYEKPSRTQCFEPTQKTLILLHTIRADIYFDM